MYTGIITDLMEANKGNLPYCSIVGGYRHTYLDESNEVYCVDCANKNKEDMTAVMIHWEGESMHCNSCNSEIESEYGNPETV